MSPKPFTLAAGAGLFVLLGPLTQGSALPLDPGERAFQKCYACHSVDASDAGLTGPSLRGILGRTPATEPGFAYSKAMRDYAKKQKKWDRAALDAFLADPQEVVPRNEMGFFGMRNPAERKALIDWLTKH